MQNHNVSLSKSTEFKADITAYVRLATNSQLKKIPSQLGPLYKFTTTQEPP